MNLKIKQLPLKFTIRKKNVIKVKYLLALLGRWVLRAIPMGLGLPVSGCVFVVVLAGLRAWLRTVADWWWFLGIKIVNFLGPSRPVHKPISLVFPRLRSLGRGVTGISPYLRCWTLFSLSGRRLWVGPCNRCCLGTILWTPSTWLSQSRGLTNFPPGVGTKVHAACFVHDDLHSQVQEGIHP